jgi:hypothetical protein
MSPIITTTEVARPATQVFAYATDPTRFHEWQEGVVDGHLDKPGPPQAGEMPDHPPHRLGQPRSDLRTDPRRPAQNLGSTRHRRTHPGHRRSHCRRSDRNALPPDHCGRLRRTWHRQDSCPASRSPPGTKRDAKKPRDIEATDRNGAGAILRLTGLTFVGIEYPRKKRAPQRGGLSILCAGLCSIQLPLSVAGLRPPLTAPSRPPQLLIAQGEARDRLRPVAECSVSDYLR